MSDLLTQQRILIIGPSNIGDAILAGDVIDAVSTRYPHAHLTLVIGERAKPLFVDDPRIQTLVETEQFDSPLGRLKLAFILWRYHPHIVVDLRHTLYPLLLKPFAGWRYVRQPPKQISHMRDRHLWKLQAQVPGFHLPRSQRTRATAGGKGRGVLMSMITQIVSVSPQIKPSAKSMPKSAKSTKLGQYRLGRSR